MIDPPAGMLIVLITLVLVWLVAGARSALVNSQAGTLLQLQSEGATGAGGALATASMMARLILSTRIVLGLLRLIVVGVAVATYTTPVAQAIGGVLSAGAAGGFGSGKLVGLSEFP